VSGDARKAEEVLIVKEEDPAAGRKRREILSQEA
jgi:hypothetical protein